jgi:hypothetical protein
VDNGLGHAGADIDALDGHGRTPQVETDHAGGLAAQAGMRKCQ